MMPAGNINIQIEVINQTQFKILPYRLPQQGD